MDENKFEPGDIFEYNTVRDELKGIILCVYGDTYIFREIKSNMKFLYTIKGSPFFELESYIYNDCKKIGTSKLTKLLYLGE